MTQLVKETSSDYQTFLEEFTELVKDRMGKEYTARVYKVTKNNSLELDSLVLLKEGRNIAPNIYLLPYYEAYLNGANILDLTDQLCSIYEKCETPVIQEDLFNSFEELKPFVFYRLVSYEKNKKLLEKTPHIKYLDLAITFYCLVRNDDDGIGTIRINDDHMKLWRSTIQELYELSVQNTCKLFPAAIRSMDEVIYDMLKQDLESSGDEMPSDEILSSFLTDCKARDKQRMYVLTNEKGINGATCLMYNNILKDFAGKIGTDLFILPSSIHEVILVPYDKSITRESLSEMVKEVNLTQVAEDEVLSDRVYFYSCENNAVTM